MNGQRIGYARVSTVDQNSARQIEVLTALNLDRIFEDKQSGKNLDRPELARLRQHVRLGDEVYVPSMDRLARNLRDLEEVVQSLIDKGVVVHFLKEGLRFTNESNSTARLLLNLIGAVAQFEREMILERQREGIAIAKAAGRYRGGKPKLAEDKIQTLRARVAQGVSKALVARELGITRQTLYAYLQAD